MTQHLDGPLESWPFAPRRLLGVDANADKRAVRQAYSQLIKRFRPEDSPAEFQRIREAYESVLAELDGPAIRLSSVSGNPFSPKPTGSHSVQHSFTGKEEASPQHPAVDEQWLRFEKEPQQVYQELVEQSEASPIAADFLRLYWALLLEPALDAREATDWLTIGLSSLGLDCYELMEVYTQRLQTVAQECSTDRCNQLLVCEGSLEAYCNLAFQRWRALAISCRWRVILDDIETVKKRVRVDSAEQWGKLLLSLTNPLFQARDTDGKSLRSLVASEVREISEIQLQLEAELQHLEMMDELRKSLPDSSARSQQIRDLLSLVRDSVCQDFLKVKYRLWKLANQWRHSPANALKTVDELAEISPTAVFILLRQMELIRYSLMPDMFDEAGLVSPISEFAKQNSHCNYVELRDALLKLCVDENIHPSDFAASFARIAGSQKRQVAQLASNIEYDMPLMCVCMGAQATILNN